MRSVEMECRVGGGGTSPFRRRDGGGGTSTFRRRGGGGGTGSSIV
jgi:hypothetical protein